MWIDRFVSLFLLFVGVVFFISSFQYTMLANAGGIGSAFIPRILSFILIVMIGLYLWKSFRIKRTENNKKSRLKEIFKQQSILIISLCLCILLTETLGMLVTWGIFLVGSLIYFERISLLKSLILSVATIIGIYLVFTKWLKLTLPAGILF